MAQVLYITDDELVQLSSNAQAIQTFPLAQRDKARLAASALIDTRMRAQFDLPLIQWGDDVKQWAADVAIWRLYAARGYNPAAPGDTNLRTKYEDAIKDLDKVAAGLLNPDVTDSSPGAVEGEQEPPSVVSGSQRGWSSRGTNNGGGDFVGD